MYLEEVDEHADEDEAQVTSRQLIVSMLTVGSLNKSCVSFLFSNLFRSVLVDVALFFCYVYGILISFRLLACAS